MNWLNLSMTVLSSEELLSSEPTDRATWLFLLAYCAGQENGGTIKDAASWGDRKWQQLVRVTLEEVKRPSRLWRFDGQSLKVSFYPHKHEARTKQLRRQSKRAASVRWEEVQPPVNRNGHHE